VSNARKHRTIGTWSIDVTPTIADKFLNTVQCKGRRTLAIQSDSIYVSKFKMIFQKGYMPNWITVMFRIVKVQKTNPVMYLLEDYREKSIAGGFFELHRVANPDVYLTE